MQFRSSIRRRFTIGVALALLHYVAWRVAVFGIHHSNEVEGAATEFFLYGFHPVLARGLRRLRIFSAAPFHVETAPVGSIWAAAFCALSLPHVPGDSEICVRCERGFLTRPLHSTRR